jgi:preprotein translocase subunit SecF
MLRILHNTNYDVLRHWRKTAVVVVAFLVPALLWVVVRGYSYSIEFTGGTLMQLEFREPVDAGRIRNVLGDAGVGNVEIQTFGTPNELVVRAQDRELVERQQEGADAVAQHIRASLTQAYGEDGFEVVRTETVGPKVGGELRGNAVIALLISFGVTLLYLAWRFEWRFGVAALIATIHDILATLAFMRYADVEISLFVVGAILTVIGYSLNDTIVVFDRVRENLRTQHKPPLYEVLNRSVNETLPRTVLTGTTTLATLLALCIFGGEVIRPFAMVLIFGIVVGTFSSIFVASPVLLWIERRWPHTPAKTSSGSKAPATTKAPPAQARRRPAGA